MQSMAIRRKGLSLSCVCLSIITGIRYKVTDLEAIDLPLPTWARHLTLELQRKKIKRNCVCKLDNDYDDDNNNDNHDNNYDDDNKDADDNNDNDGHDDDKDNYNYNDVDNDYNNDDNSSDEAEDW